MARFSSRDPGMDHYMHYDIPGVDPERIEWESIPQWVRDDNPELEDERKKVAMTDMSENLLKAIPYVGNFFAALLSPFYQSRRQRYLQHLEDTHVRYANWYNSPAQQMKRFRIAGINPYVNGNVKSYPASQPSTVPFQNLPSVSSSSDFTSFLRLLQNQPLVDARVQNLESLTDINSFKYDYLLPQLFDRNGYLNSILELQSAWESNNYDYERQLKQNLLDTSYMVSVALLGQKIMELQPNTENARTIVDVQNGTIRYVDTETGSDIDLSKLSFSELPLFIQDAYIDVFSKQSNISLNSARQTLLSAQVNTQNAMAALYNSNRQKVDIDVDAYRRTGVWSTEDPTLRFAANLMEDQVYWKKFGLNSLNQLQDAAIDLGTSYLSPKYLMQGKTPTVMPSPPVASPAPVTPQRLKIPYGAKPFTYKGQIYYYQP